MLQNTAGLRIPEDPVAGRTAAPGNAVRLQEEEPERETDGLEDYYEEEDPEDKPDSEI
ncbi:MAG TPA: hypothetical protein PLM79_02750 [Syntrophobacteraceae bacterium]|nr:hypothetical protein [Syntrophobacteraceae bacterium]